MNGHDACSDEAAFRRAVLADPGDDAPRLIYADWLDEHGRPERAELIRLQCAIERHGPRDLARLPLIRQQNLLFLRHRDDWVGRLPPGLRVNHFSRGFAIVDVSAKASVFVDRAAMWESQTPPEHLFRLKLQRAQEDLERVLAAPLWARTVRVEFFSSLLGDEGAKRLAASQALRSVVDLGLGWNKLTSVGAKALAESPGLGNVRSLNLHQNGLGDEGLAALANSPYLNRLASLQLGGCRIAGAGVRALAESPLIDRLERLILSGEAVGDEGVAALVRERRGAKLRELGLSLCNVGDDGATLLATRPQLASLRSLDLTDNAIGDRGAAALAESPHLEGLNEIKLTHNRIGPRGLMLLEERFGSRVHARTPD